MEKRDDFYIPEEIAEWIGLKKSEYLSRLIQKIGPDDISFEEYSSFDHFIHQTIELPDRIFETIIDGYVVQTYLRTFTEKAGFHQLVIGVVIQDKSSGDKVFVPILTFVSRKNELVQGFCEGEAKLRPTFN